MTTRQILNRIVNLSALAAQCIAQGARAAAIEFYNLILGYELRLLLKIGSQRKET